MLSAPFIAPFNSIGAIAPSKAINNNNLLGLTKFHIHVFIAFNPQVSSISTFSLLPILKLSSISTFSLLPILKLSSISTFSLLSILKLCCSHLCYQGSSSVPRNGGAGLPSYPQGGAGPPHYQGSGAGDDRVDMVLSESLNDPGFRDNLLYTLQAEVEQYPTLVTPPLSSSDCSYSADYINSGYSTSPHGSDASLEDEPYTTGASSTNSYHTGDSLYTPNNTPYYHSHDQTESRTSPTESATYYQNSEQNELCESVARSANIAGYYRNSTEQQVDSSTTSGSLASYYQNCEQGEHRDVKPLSNAEKFIDNMCVGVKYFLASHKKHPGEPGEAYTITEDRTHSLLTLARVIQAKLDSLKEAERLMAEVNGGPQTGQCREEGYVTAGPGSVYEYL
ncbi:hypothetical protein WDU94_007729 [Cyamophila willieti]